MDQEGGGVIRRSLGKGRGRRSINKAAISEILLAGDLRQAG